MALAVQAFRHEGGRAQRNPLDMPTSTDYNPAWPDPEIFSHGPKFADPTNSGDLNNPDKTTPGGTNNQATT